MRVPSLVCRPAIVLALVALTLTSACRSSSGSGKAGDGGDSDDVGQPQDHGVKDEGGDAFEQDGDGLGSPVPGSVAIYASCSIVAGYDGPLFDVTRLSDQTSQTFNATSNGAPDLGALTSFLGTSVGFVTKIYDQSGHGNDVTQTVLASAPVVDLTRRNAGGCPPFVADYFRRSYAATVGEYVGTATTPPSQVVSILGTARFSGPMQPMQQGIVPGMTLSGTNISGADPITAVDYVHNTLTLAQAPTGPLSFTLPGVSWPSGTTSFTFTGTIPSWLAKGLIVVGAGVPGYQVVDTVTKGTQNTVAIKNAEGSAGVPVTGSPTTLTFYVPLKIGNVQDVFMDLPTTVQVPFDDHSVFTVLRPGDYMSEEVPVTLGVPFATTTGMSFDGLVLGRDSRINAPAGLSYSIPQSSFVPRGLFDVYGYTRSGTSLSWYAEDASGTTTFATDPGATALPGGSLFASSSYAVPQDGSVDNDGSNVEMYATIVYPKALTDAEVQTLKSQLTTRFALSDVKNTIIFDGSSTTFGAGTDSIYNSSHMTVDAIASQYPSRAFDVAPGGCIEEQTYFFQQTVVPLTKLPGYVQENEHIVVYHPGLGNSIQAGGQYTVTAQSGAVLTVSPAPGTAPLGSVTSSLFPGIHVRGTNNLADDYVVTAITTDTVTLNAAPTPSVMGSTIEIVSDTGQDAWQAIETYLTQAHDAGFKVVLIGSASRAPFDDEYYLASDIWLTQFRTAKALMAANWQAAGAAAYIDLETDPAFGADTAMNVVGVSGANVTVSALGSYTVVGNYVTWAGNDTAVTIKALSGNVLTLSVQPPTALTQLEDFNPAPWVNSTLWNLDGQHFTYAGYEKIAQLTATALVGAGLIP